MLTDKLRSRFLPMSETMCYILLSLLEERHGYGVMLHVKALTEGRIVLGAGTIYQSLGKLEQSGLIDPVREEERKKIYRITPAGRELLAEETARVGRLYRALAGGETTGKEHSDEE